MIMDGEVLERWEALLAEFYNHLRLQQWELVQCYARTLVTDRHVLDSRTRVSNLLKSITASYKTASVRSSIYLPDSPQNLSRCFIWLCNRLLRDFGESDALLEEETEFCMLISNVLSDATSHILDELHEIFLVSRGSTGPARISDEFVDLLGFALCEKPHLAHCLLMRLLQLASRMRNKVVASQLLSVYWRSLEEDEHNPLTVVALMPDSALQDPSAKDVLRRVLDEDAVDALLGRESPQLLQFYYENEDLPKESWFTSDEEIDFHEMFLQTLRKRQHFLESLLNVSAHHVLLNGKVPNGFHKNWLKKLKPLILVAAWQLCKTDKEFYNLMAAIECQVDDSGHPVADKVSKKLKRNCFLAKWFTDRFRIMLGLPDIEQRIFDGLQTQSPLRVLNKYIGLRNIEPGVTLSMLKESASFFKGDGIDSEMTVFRSYLATFYAMEAVNAAAKLEILSSEVGLSLVCESDKTMASFLAKEGFEATYNHFIGKRLEDMRTELLQILPVTYRIEVLENIFSLLFVTRSDVNDTLSDDSDEGYIGDEQRTEVSSCGPGDEEDNEGSQLERKISAVMVSSTPPDGSTSSSSCAISKEGFLCNEFIVGDLLTSLKDTILDAMPLVYGAVGNRSEEFPDKIVASSVNRDNLQKRFSTLSAYVNEAQWRLVLLSGDNKSSVVPKDEISRSVSKERLLSGGRRERRKRRRRKKRRFSVVDGNLGAGIIPRMLSSPDSLLRFSILQGKLGQAEEVVQLFSLQHSSDALELQFSRNLPEILKNLNAGALTGRTLTCKSTVGSDLCAVARAASEGLRATSEMLVIDKILSTDLLPKIPELELLEPDVAASLEFADLQSIVLADLAYTSCWSLERTLFLLEKAAHKLQHALPVDALGPPAVKGIIAVLTDTVDFFQELSNVTATCLPYIREIQPSRTLSCQLGPLSSKNVKVHAEFWETFFGQFAKVRGLLAEDEQTTVVLLGEEMKYTPERLHMAFLELCRICLKNVGQFVSRKRFDYLGTLYERVKRVSHVLAECKNKSGPPAHQSYFSVLKQSHVGILGTLVLQRPLSILEFHKLDDFAQQLQLDLVNVIIQTCCPAIAVRRDLTFTVADEKRKLSQGTLPLLSQPEPLAWQILSSLLQILRDACSDSQSDGPLTMDNIVQLALQPQMLNWLESCNQIANVDLNLLIGSEEKLAFFANVTNIAWMWAIFSHFRFTATQGKKALRHQLFSCKLLSQFPVERLIGQKNTFFSIGQIGPINLFDLKHRLVVGNGPVPSHYLTPPNKFVSDSREIQNYFPSVEPRLLFVFVEGFFTSPKLQILQPNLISEQLNEAMTEYLTNQVEVDIFHEIVRLPEMLRWYRQSFVADDPTAPYEGLVNFVADIIGGDFKQALQSLQALDSGSPKEQGLPFKLEFIPSTTFVIVLEYGSLSSSPTSFLQKQGSNSWPPEYIVRYIGQRCSPLARVLELINCSSKNTELETSWESPLGRQLSRWRNLSSDQNVSSGLVIAALSPTAAGQFLWQQIQRCIDEESFDKALRYAEETIDPGTLLLRECLLTCHAVHELSDEHPEPWSYVLRIEDPVVRFETLVRSLERWSEDECLTVLNYCLALSKKYPEVCLLIKEKLTEMQLYKKTVRLLKAGPGSSILRWQDLMAISPEKVISELRTTGRVDLIVEWAHLNRVAKLADDRQKMDHAAEEQDLLDSSFLEKSKLLNLGMQMLDHIRENDKGLYQGLVQMPMILLEQLLMNAEIAIADSAIASIKNHLATAGLHEVNQLIEQYAGKALEFIVVEVVPESVDSASVKSVTDDQFTMPARVPSKEEWVPDSSVITCMVCLSERFSMFSRRHHCRRCGRVVCASCSQHSVVVAGYRKEPVRVCDNCYEQSVYTQLGTSPSISSGDRFLKSLEKSSMPVMRARSDSYRITPYCLSAEESENESLREEFSYDQAPSISLCLSILKLHSDPRQCGEFMITLCDDMFTKLVPRNLGRPNPEVDYAIVISMMRSLLLNAKVKFVEANHKNGVQYSDKYLSHLDLTNMLVKGNCTHLIPKEDITSDDTFRRIRDTLLEEERFVLAQDLSTKCGLEQNSLWAAWGTICLRAGEWVQARKKFARCLQKLRDRSQNQESPLLRDIITFLEDFRSSGITKFHAMSTKGTEDVIQLALEECRYYLDNYGSHSSIVSFYQRHGMFTEALRQIIDKVHDVDVFVMNLFMASLRAGRLGVLLQQVRAVDPTLSKTWRFLIATCRHLKHERLYRVLYRVQLFMEDYIRAGMTSIHFFRIPASRCSELYERLPHLEAARNNFERYLNQDPNGRETLKLSTEEVQRYLQTVLLQRQITIYLYTCESKDMDIRVGNVAQKMLASEKLQNSLPTLFDGSVQKTTLSVLLLVYGAFEEGGMDFALQVILNHNLDGTKVCSLAAQELVNVGGVNEFLALVSYIRIRPASYGLDMDSVIGTSIALLANQPGKAKEAEMLIRQMASDANKINAYIVCGLLKSAYFLAIRLSRVSDVERIREAAAATGQLSIQAICDKWLESKRGS